MTPNPPKRQRCTRHTSDITYSLDTYGSVQVPIVEPHRFWFNCNVPEVGPCVLCTFPSAEVDVIRQHCALQAAMNRLGFAPRVMDTGLTYARDRWGGHQVAFVIMYNDRDRADPGSPPETMGTTVVTVVTVATMLRGAMECADAIAADGMLWTGMRFHDGRFTFLSNPVRNLSEFDCRTLVSLPVVAGVSDARARALSSGVMKLLLWFEMGDLGRVDGTVVAIVGRDESVRAVVDTAHAPEFLVFMRRISKAAAKAAVDCLMRGTQEMSKRQLTTRLKSRAADNMAAATRAGRRAVHFPVQAAGATAAIQLMVDELSDELAKTHGF